MVFTSPSTVKARYLSYLSHANDRNFAEDSLAPYIAETIQFNGAPLSRTAFIAQVSHFVKHIPGLFWNLQLFVAETKSESEGGNGSSTISVRILFEQREPSTDGSLENGRIIQKGFTLDGQYIDSEHVFYQIDKDGRICEIWHMMNRKPMGSANPAARPDPDHVAPSE
jgi:predicted ester cyclase